MKTTSAGALGVVILLLVLAGAATWFAPSAHFTGYIRVRTDELPAQVGDYRGETIYFCQNQQCLASFTAPELGSATVCPHCEHNVDLLSPAEREVLPPGTTILKKSYAAPLGPSIFVSVVFSAENQRSIHRPQRCLQGQGYVIENTRTVSIPRSGQDPLKVQVLSVRPRSGSSGNATAAFMTYAYWYTGGDYETPYHYDRLARIARDRIFKNRLDRWAYVALSIQHHSAEDPTPRLEAFIARLYPLIQKE